MPNDIDEELEDGEVVEPTPDDIKGLRAAADRSKANKAEADAMRRENAMLKAGIDTESPIGALFAGGYKGELDKEAVKAAWAELGVSSATPADTPVVDTPPDNDDHLSADEKASTAERRALANGATADRGTTPDPRSEAKVRHQSVIDAGGKSDDAMVAYFDTVLTAAGAGDKRVIVEGFQG